MLKPQTTVATSRHTTLTPLQLRATRESWSMTQTQLANVLGVSVATVCRWERQRLNSDPDLPLWLSYALLGYWRARQGDLQALDSENVQ